MHRQVPLLLGVSISSWSHGACIIDSSLNQLSQELLVALTAKPESASHVSNMQLAQPPTCPP